MALPWRVQVKKSLSAANRANVHGQHPQTLGLDAAPRTMTGRTPEKAGRAMVSLPKVSMAPPRSMMDTPMVMMTALRAGAPARGRMVKRSIKAPTTAVARQAASTARGNGSPVPRKPDGEHAAEHHELALGEVDDTRGVENHGEAQPDQPVGGSLGEARHQILTDACQHYSPMIFQSPLSMVSIMKASGPRPA